MLLHSLWACQTGVARNDTGVASCRCVLFLLQEEMMSMEDHLLHRKSPSRRTIESKLAQDEVRLTELQASLTKSKDLTGGMVSLCSWGE